MAIAHVQDNYSTSTVAATSTTVTLNGVTGTDVLVAMISCVNTATVASITDNQNNRWIRCSQCPAPQGLSANQSEIWYARGVNAGNTTVTVTFSGSVTFGVNLSEWSGVYTVQPLDMDAQNYGVSAAPTTAVLPTGLAQTDVVLALTSAAGVLTGGPLNSFIGLSFGGSATGISAGYRLVNPAGISTSWTQSGSHSWSTCIVALQPGAATLNPNGDATTATMPETIIEMSTNSNWQVPIWQNFSRYVQKCDVGPIGRQHWLDRVQAAPAKITVNNRDGTFNPWNSNSSLYNGGTGLRPMNPVRIVASWNGVSYPVYYGYLQGVPLTLTDVLNATSELDCIDIFQYLALNYLSHNQYAQAVIADGGANLLSYWRCGDSPGSAMASVSGILSDSSGNGVTAQMFDGALGNLAGSFATRNPNNPGLPLLGQPGPIIYDPNTSVDLTNGSNTSSGYFFGIPAPGGVTGWNIEMFFQYIGPNPPGSYVLISVIHGIASNLDLVIGSFSGYTNRIGGYALAGLGTTLQFVSAFTNPCDGNWHHLQWICGSADGILLIDGGNTNLIFGSYPTNISLTEVIIGADNNSWGGAAPVRVAEVSTCKNASVATTFHHYSPGPGSWFTTPETLGQTLNANPPLTRLERMLTVAGIPTGWTATYGTQPAVNSMVVFEDGRYPLTELAGEVYQYSTNASENSVGGPAPATTQISSITSQTALNYLQTLSETEPGIVYGFPDGTIHVQNREHQYTNANSITSQATFGDGVGMHPFNALEWSPIADDADIWNDIQIQSARPGSTLQEWGPAQSAAATASMNIYGERTLQGLTGLLQLFDSDALAMAQNYLSWYKDLHVRIDSIQFDNVATVGGVLGYNLPQALGRVLMERVTISYTGQTNSSTLSGDFLVESIAQMIDFTQGKWTTTWSLSPYEILLSPILLGTSLFGGTQVLTL